MVPSTGLVPAWLEISDDGAQRLRFACLWIIAFILMGDVSAAAGAQGLTTPAAKQEHHPDATLIVGGDRSYPPYEFIDAEGRPAGYNVELTQAIARVMGFHVEIRLGRWADLRRALETGQIDALEGVCPSEERARLFDFTPPHTMVHHSLFARRGSPSAKSFEDLKGKTVLVLRAGIIQDTLERFYPEVRPIPADTQADALQQLAAGRHDYALMAKLPGLYLIRQLKLTNIVPTGNPLTAERYGFAVAHGNTALAARLSEGLAILKNTGEYQAIYEKWLGVLEPREINLWQVFRYGLLAFAPLALLFGGMTVWSRALQREVALRTTELTREIAEHKRTEEELRRNQQQLLLAGKMAALGVLVSGVAHEINNPNGLILLDLQLLDDILRDAEPIFEEHHRLRGDFTLGSLRYSRLKEALPRMMTDALDAARRVKRIVEDLKDFGRQGSSDRRDGVSFNEVVQAAVRLVDNLIHKSTSRFQVDYASDLPTIRGNSQRIEQVVVNLVMNACQALPTRDRAIQLRTYADTHRQAVGLEVHDEGVGIAPEHLPQLTDPFFTTKRERGGTGLGLAISADIIKEHGGALTFESTPGQGTTVRLLFPLPGKERQP